LSLEEALNAINMGQEVVASQQLTTAANSERERGLLIKSGCSRGGAYLEERRED
jgi:hypothetical protein